MTQMPRVQELFIRGASSASINTPQTTYPSLSACPLNNLSLAKTLDSSKECLRNEVVANVGVGIQKRKESRSC